MTTYLSTGVGGLEIYFTTEIIAAVLFYLREYAYRYLAFPQALLFIGVCALLVIKIACIASD